MGLDSLGLITASMMVRLDHPDGTVTVEERPGGRREVRVEPGDPSVFVPRRSCETSYPDELIQALLELKGICYLCDEIARDEDPLYIANFLRYAILGFVSEAEFSGRRVLDFGSGAGASTMVLSRMLPGAELVGVELRQNLVDIARMRARVHGAENASFYVSPDPESLPDNLGDFDFVVFSAVFEHLLPAERPALLAQVWSVLRPGGVLLISDTPHRWYPHEFHTTGIPLLNYLPDRLAWRVGRLSPRVDSNASWEEMLRDGVRGGTEGEVMRLLGQTGDGTPVSLAPSRLGCKDQVDLWYAFSMEAHPSRVKWLMRVLFKAVSRVSGQGFAPSVVLAIRKI